MLLPQEPYPVLKESYPVSTESVATPNPLAGPATAITHLLAAGARPRILLVDDNENDILLTRRSLEEQDCEVVSASSVPQALHRIATQPFDVLITDLHMPGPGDGFALVTAMRHTQPSALTLVVSDYPDVQKAMNAILLQADEILVKPLDCKRLAGLMDKARVTSLPPLVQAKEGIASILERDLPLLMQRWLARVEQVPELAALPLTPKDRTSFLPDMMKGIIARLRVDRHLDVIDNPSPAAATHGQCRYLQSYTAPLIVQESRLLQVSIFETIQCNLATVDFTSVLPDIMILADEVDSQLKQAIASFLNMQRTTSAAGA
jgi:CheY-like chemotaxis protein